MVLHEFITVKGCVTQEKYIKGRTLLEIENILGFQKGRLSKGLIVAALLQIPSPPQFELLGYTQVAEHKFNPGTLKGLDIDKLKELVRKSTFTTVGANRLVKVLPNTAHLPNMANDEQYPPGLGAPQWKLTTLMHAQIIAVVNAGKRFL